MRNKPDKEWMIGLLGFMNPGDDIFKKGYKPPPKDFNNAMQMQGKFPVREGFFDGLEVLSSKDLRKKTSVSFLSKKQKLEMQLARIQEREQKLQLAKEKKEADI